VKPEGTPRGAVVVVQEIFGVNSHIRRVAEQYAAEGYLAIAPAMFDRLQKGVDLDYDAAGLQAGIDLMMRVTNEGAIADVNAAIGAVAHAGRVGMVGYCWGGRITYLAGCKTNIAAGVAYYGGGIAQLLGDTPRCPMLFHFGEHDSHIPLSDVNPASGERVGSVPVMGGAETRRAIEAAAAALPAWRAKLPKERAQILRRWAELMHANADDLATLMTAEQGKPLAEARGEIAYAAAFFEWFAEEGGASTAK
jgi:carboxymethylenebutenolidase